MNRSLTKRQAEIVNRSIELIADGGIQQLTIKNIANQLGVSEPAIYRHFKSKFDVLLAIIANFKDETEEVVQSVENTDGGALDKIWAMFEAHISHFVDRPAVAAVIFSEETFRHEPKLIEKILEIVIRNQMILLQQLEYGQRCGELRQDIPMLHLATTTMGSFRMLIMRWRLSHHNFDLLDEAQKLWQSISLMIAAHKPN